MLLWPDLVIDSSLSRPDISLCALDKFVAFEELPDSVKEEEDWDVDIGNQEALIVEATDEYSKAVKNYNDAKEADSEPSTIHSSLGPENQSVAVDILGFESITESEIGDADGDPCEKLGNGDEILEPSEGNLGSVADSHVCEERYGCCEGHGVDWNTGLCAFEEDLWGLSVLGYTEEITRSSVEEGVGG